MGREASCYCEWAAEAGECKVLLETHELIVRGAIRRRVALSGLTEVAVDGERLLFRVGDEKGSLALGAKLAKIWAAKIVVPPPTLAAKFGVATATRLWVIGEIESEALREAANSAASTDGKQADLVLICAEDLAQLYEAMRRFNAASIDAPFWVAYRKGAKSPLPEAVVRETLRGMGFMDTKVAAVDAAYTALRFIRRA